MGIFRIISLFKLARSQNFKIHVTYIARNRVFLIFLTYVL